MVVEHVFQARLTVVEITVQRQRVHVAFRWCGHLSALHFGHATVGEEDEDIDVIQPAEGFDRGRSGIARGRTDDGHPFPLARQNGLEHVADQLHGKVFERQRRTVEQFKQEVPLFKLHQRRAHLVVEARIGLGDQRLEFIVAECVADKGFHHTKGDILVGHRGHLAQLIGAKRRDRFGHIQAAVTGEAGQQRLFERQNGGGTTGGDITHKGQLSVLGARRRRKKNRLIPSQIAARENQVMAYCKWSLGIRAVSTGNGLIPAG